MQTSIAIYLSVIVCLHLQMLFSGAIFTGRCPPECICPWNSRADKQEINCAANGFVLEVETTNSHLLERCNDIDHANTFDDISWNLRDFFSSNVELRKLTLQRCAIPANRSLAEMLSPFLTHEDADNLKEATLDGHDSLISQALAASFLNQPKSLEQLIIVADTCSLQQLPSLSHLQRLNLINIHFNHGLQLTSGDTFANLTKLRNVTLKNNRLTKLPHDVFHTNRGIRYLDLSYNRLRELSPDLFQNQTILGALWLQGNQLEGELPNQLFSQTTRLFLLDLSNNALEIINSELFGNLHNLMDLLLRNNRIQKIDANAFNVNRLYRLYLAHNNLTLEEPGPGPFHRLENLRILDLSYNAIRFATRVQHQNQMRKLETLNLSHNNITRIAYADLLFASKKMHKFFLDGNPISTIDFSDETESGNLPKEVKLTGNPLRCDRHIHRFVRNLRNKLKLHMDELKCDDSNEELSNTGVSE